MAGPAVEHVGASLGAELRVLAAVRGAAEGKLPDVECLLSSSWINLMMLLNTFALPVLRTVYRFILSPVSELVLWDVYLFLFAIPFLPSTHTSG